MKVKPPAVRKALCVFLSGFKNYLSGCQDPFHRRAVSKSPLRLQTALHHGLLSQLAPGPGPLGHTDPSPDLHKVPPSWTPTDWMEGGSALPYTTALLRMGVSMGRYDRVPRSETERGNGVWCRESSSPSTSPPRWRTARTCAPAESEAPHQPT